MAAWHSERPDAVQIAPLLPGPAGALPHYGASGTGAEALRTPPTVRTGFDCNVWNIATNSLSHMGQMGFNSWT